MKLETDVMFTQMSAKSGINKFVEKAVVAMVKECIYIDKGPMEGNPVVTPIDPGILSYEYKRKALEVVNLIKEIETVKLREGHVQMVLDKKVT